MRAYAKDLGISLNSVQHAVRNDLNGQSLVKKCVPLPSEKNITARLKRCRSLVNHLKHAHSGQIIFFSNEKNFCVDPVCNSRNIHLFGRAQKLMRMFPQLLKKFITKTKHPASLTMFPLRACLVCAE